LNVEEIVISLISIKGSELEDIAVALSFMDKARGIYLQTHSLEAPSAAQFQVMLERLSLPWHQLRFFECHSRPAPLASLLNILQQMPSLEQCRLTIYDDPNNDLTAVSMPTLCYLKLSLTPLVDPTIIIPLIGAPNITALCVYSWSEDTYSALKKLCQLQEFSLHGRYPALRLSQVLTDAPMVHTLYLDRSDVGVETRTLNDIASGKLGRYLSSLSIHSGFFNDKLTREFLNALETRQKHVKSMATQVSNWQQMPTGIRTVVLFASVNGMAYRDRTAALAALKALGTTVTLFGSSRK
jgi:hypothetical protein